MVEVALEGEAHPSRLTRVAVASRLMAARIAGAAKHAAQVATGALLLLLLHCPGCQLPAAS